MKKRHYFLDQTLTQTEQKHTMTVPEQIKHIKNILKLTAGEEIVITNGQGHGGIFEIIEYQKEGILVHKVKDLVKQHVQKEVTLACAILKQDHFELVTQKATELGASTIVPLLTDRTVKNGLKDARIQKIICEAAEQSEQLTFPILSEALSLKKYIDSLTSTDFVYLLDPSGIPHVEVLFEKESARTILVGPEGGWTDDELALAREAGITIVSLGTTILRAETAAIVGTFWAMQ
jgi:16S rRNA (uracil1498-N3)-methyltransferase